MSKLYVFAIGGTGSRVLKSLSFLLASGVECNTTEIVPIIIDPDSSNGDVEKTVDILHSYQNIHNHLEFDNHSKNKFFSTPIGNLNENFKIRIANSNKSFKDFIGYDTLDPANKAMVSLLFSQQNLNADMNVGFKGNPNMGSVVLNQFHNSNDFLDFVQNFGSNDRIFIISSIFGGTGASGFPLLLKNLRNPDPNWAAAALLKNAPIGAISVLPYFGVKSKDNAVVDKATFMSKTKAALRYYLNGVNSSVDTIYYIGDEPAVDYDHYEGEMNQKNDSHFIELASALAVVDFANQPEGSQIREKEFGIDEDSQNITFKDLNQKTKDIIFKPLTQYYLLNLFLENKLKVNFDARFAAELGINSQFLNQPFYEEMKFFNDHFWEWLKEMSNNKRGFSPFKLDKTTNNIFEVTSGISLKNGGFLRPKNYERFIDSLNSSLSEIPSGKKETRFTELFYIATDKLVIEN